MWLFVQIHHSSVQAGDYNVKNGGNSDISEGTRLPKSIHNKCKVRLKTLSQPSSSWLLASLYFHFHKHWSGRGPGLWRHMQVTQLFTPSIMGHFFFLNNVNSHLEKICCGKETSKHLIEAALVWCVQGLCIPQCLGLTCYEQMVMITKAQKAEGSSFKVAVRWITAT